MPWTTPLEQRAPLEAGPTGRTNSSPRKQTPSPPMKLYRDLQWLPPTPLRRTHGQPLRTGIPASPPLHPRPARLPPAVPRRPQVLKTRPCLHKEQPAALPPWRKPLRPPLQLWKTLPGSRPQTEQSALPEPQESAQTDPLLLTPQRPPPQTCLGPWPALRTLPVPRRLEGRRPPVPRGRTPVAKLPTLRARGP